MAEQALNQKPETQCKVTIAGNAMILTSTLKFEDIQKLEIETPEILCMTEEKDDEIIETFRIATGATSSIAKYGVVFAEKNSEGYAQATVLLPTTVSDKKNYVCRAYATVLMNLNNITKCVLDECAHPTEKYGIVNDMIEEV